MADLIDRDELIKTLEAHCNAIAKDESKILQQTYRMAYRHAIEVIKIYPRAYDMDNVEAKIKRHSYFMGIRESVVDTIVNIVRNGGR